MRPINMCTLEVRIGKCNLNLKSDGYVGVSLEMGKNLSSMSPIKKIQSSTIQFNTTLRMNVEKQLIQQQGSSNCRILLHLVKENRQKKVIGIATVDVVRENNQSFKYHQFGQCADCEADIEVSISYGVSFQLGVKSQIGYFYTSESRFHQGNYLEHSRGNLSYGEDSILDNEDYNVLKQSKAVSHIEPYSENRPRKKSYKLKARRTSDPTKLRKTKPQNFSSCAPEEIITHYETEIKTLEEEFIEREEWATGMKILVQELQAQNQLLKELTIEQMEARNINNVEQGIEYVSKLVHSKFEASRSMIYESPNSQERNKLKTPESELRESEIKEQMHESGEENVVPQKSLTQTTSYKDLPQHQVSPRIQIQESPQKSVIQTQLAVLESRQELQNALKILTGQDKSIELTQLKTKISELQEQLFALRQEKQELYDMTEELYSESKNIKQERDSLYKDVKSLQSQLEKMQQYIQTIKTENLKIKQENQKYEKNYNNEEFQKLNLENQALFDKSRQLERQLKESLKAIQEFKNDALNARSELITKQDELNCYKMKFGELGSMTDVFVSISRLEYDQSENKREDTIKQRDAFESPTQKIDSTTTSTTNLHSLYTQLLESSISQRKQLQHSLSQTLASKTDSTMVISQSLKRQQSLKKLQTQINKMFIELLKNRPQINNIREIQKAKLQITRQIQQIVSNI